MGEIRKEFLPLAKPDISQLEIDYSIEVIKSGWLTTGPKVDEFEKNLALYLTTDNTSVSAKQELSAIGLNSCTSALHLALVALGIGKGDEVILPTWTFASTALVVEWVGAKPVLCDIDENTLTIDIDKAEELINDKTKAIIPVHIGGCPCDMAKIAYLAEKYRLKVIEDAAHAIGSKYRGDKIGTFSDITCFSFYATKNLAMGEGGAAVSKDKDLIDKIRKLSYLGINKDAFKRYSKSGNWFYDIEMIGYKNNLDSLHAAIGLAQLERLDDMNSCRRKIAGDYRKNLTKKVEFFKDTEDVFHTYHLFQIRINSNRINRDEMILKLKERNIGTSVHFIPLHRHSHFMKRMDQKQFPVANKMFEQALSIPMFSSMVEQDTDYVIEQINNLIDN